MEKEIKKNYFFLRIFNISPCVFTQISIKRDHWMQNLITHPMSTHSAYFWHISLPKNKKYMKKHYDHQFFSRISCFWGSRVHKKYSSWVLIVCGIEFRIQRALLIEIWVKTQGDMSKIQTKKLVFLWYLSPNLY